MLYILQEPQRVHARIHEQRSLIRIMIMASLFRVVALEVVVKIRARNFFFIRRDSRWSVRRLVPQGT